MKTSQGARHELDQRRGVLSTIPLFAKVNPAKLKVLACTSERLECLSGDELFRQDDYRDAVYVILKGGRVAEVVEI